MSLLHNQDFVIHQLRAGYLQQINDGVGERLINLNTGFLNDPGYRAAGWNPNPPEAKRCYSPPIPTSGTAEYFKAPNRPVRLGEPFDEEEEEGGMVTGRPSNEAVGPAVVSRRRRRREADEEDDDSSDLSDDSNDEPEPPVSARMNSTVKFARIPERARSSSSPIRKVNRDEGPSLMITSPSKPPDGNELDRPSIGSLTPSRMGRPRRDTTTSSEISSDNDPEYPSHRRKNIAKRAAAAQRRLLDEQIAEESHEEKEHIPTRTDSNFTGVSEDTESDEDSLASDFSEEDLVNPSLLDGDRPSSQRNLSSLPAPKSPKAHDPPRKSQPAPDILPELPPPRPISTIIPVSALSLALKAKFKKAINPLDQFAQLSAPPDQNPLYIKMYLPFSEDDSKPLELAMKRVKDGGLPIAVVEVIGFTLWKYSEEQIKPALTSQQKSLNNWVLRNVEFGEVDYDFPALGRVRPMSDFTANNNRPPRARARDKPWDEFALVEADESQRKDNEQLTPKFSEEAIDDAPEEENQLNKIPSQPPTSEPNIGVAPEARRPALMLLSSQNPIVDPRHVFTSFRKDSLTQAQDVPDVPKSHAVARSGAPKTLNIHYVDNNLDPHQIKIEATTDTYISEVFDQVCSKLQVEKGLFVLKVTNTNTVAPADRMVEALGPTRSSLDLVRRRFVGDGTFGVTGSPGSTSPNAPLLLTSNVGNLPAPRRGVRRGTTGTHPLAQQQATTEYGMTGLVGGMSGLGLGLHGYKRYFVIRKQPMTFTGNTPRIIAFDGDYLHIMHAEGGGAAGRDRMVESHTGKTTTIHFSNIVGCKVYRKHPKTFRFLVFRERETKRYDFDAKTADEADEIVREIKRGVEPYRTLTDRP